MLTPSAIASWACVADAVERLGHARRALGDRPGDVDRVRRVDLVVDVAQRLELAVEQDRLVEQQLVRVLRRLVEQVALVAEASVARLITISSRIGSIGGFVTCAKSCLK